MIATRAKPVGRRRHRHREIEGRPAVVVANDATVKAGAWWPETISKILRAQEIAMRHRARSSIWSIPRRQSAVSGRHLPGQYGAGRIFYYNSLMRRKLRVPQIAAVMALHRRRAYLPALSDVIIMVEVSASWALADPTS